MSTQLGLNKNMKKTLAVAISGLVAGMAQQGYAASAGDATVVHGDATVIQQSVNQTLINQSSNKAIINWSDFNIQVDESVQFAQPGAESVVLNRVTGGNESQILGELSANGQVFLVNQNGIVFGEGAVVNVGGLTASTLDIADQDFIDGNLNFEAGSVKGSVVNLGNIQAADGGYVALLGNQVRNDGVIAARLGSVVAASGDKLSLNFDNDGLVSVEITEATLNALVENKGLIQADGGVVYMKASTASQLLSTVVNNEGVVQAASVEERDGKIVLRGWGEEAIASNTGELNTNKEDGASAGFVELSGPNFRLSGDVNTAEFLLDPADVFIDAGPDIAALNTFYSTSWQNNPNPGGITIQAEDSITFNDAIGDVFDLGTTTAFRLQIVDNGAISGFGVLPGGIISFADPNDTVLGLFTNITLDAQSVTDGPGTLGALGNFQTLGTVELLADVGDIGSAIDFVTVDAPNLVVSTGGDAYIDSTFISTSANITADDLHVDANTTLFQMTAGDVNTVTVTDALALTVFDGDEVTLSSLTNVANVNVATGAGGDVTLGNIAVTTPATDNITITSAGSVTQNGGTTITANQMNVTANGAVTLNQATNDFNTVSINNSAAIAPAAIAVSDVDDLTVTQATTNALLGSNVTIIADADSSNDAGDFLRVQGITGANVTLSAAGTIEGTAAAGVAEIDAQGFAPLVTLTSTQSSVGSSDLTRVDVQNSTAPVLTLNVTAAADAYVAVTTANAIVQGTIIADTFDIGLNNAVLYSMNPGSNVDSILLTGLAGGLNINDLDNIIIDDIDAGDMTVNAAGNVDFAGDVALTGVGSMTINTSGNVTQSVGSSISATNLTISNAGGATSGQVALNLPSNSFIGNVDVQAGGAVDIRSTGQMTVTRATAGGDIRLEANGGNLSVTQVNAGFNDVVLIAQDSVLNGGAADTTADVTGDNISITSYAGNVGPGTRMDLAWLTGLTVNATSGDAWINAAGLGANATINTGTLNLTADGSVTGLVFLNNSDVDVLNASNIATGLVVTDTDDLSVNNVSIAGTITVNAATGMTLDGVIASNGAVVLNGGTGAVTQTDESVTASSLNVSAGTTITMNQAGNSGNSVDLTAGGAISYVDSGPLTVNSAVATNSDISITVADDLVVGTVNAGLGAVDLEVTAGGNLNGQAVNSVIGGTVLLDVGTGSIADATTPLNVNSADITAVAGGDVYIDVEAANSTVDIAAASQQVVLTAVNNIDVTALAADSLSINAVGSITDSGTIAVANVADLTAGGDITLGGVAEDTNFGSLSLDGVNVSISEDSATQLDAVSATTLTIESAGDITDAGDIDVTGLASFDANSGANNITLGDDPAETSNFGSLQLTGNTVTVTEDSDMDLAGANVTTLTVSADGSIVDSGTVSVSGNSSFTATQTDADIQLDTLAVAGTVALSTTGTTADASVTNATALDLAASTVAGNLTAIATTGNLTDSGLVDVAGNAAFTTSENNASITLDTLAVAGSIGVSTTGASGDASISNNTDVDLSASTVGGALSVTAAGNITDSGDLAVTGAATFDAGAGDITLGGAGESTQFGSVDLTGFDVTLQEDDTTNLLQANVNTLSVDSAGDVVIEGSGVTALGTVDITAANSVIVNTGGDINAQELSVTATAGDIDMTDETVVFTADQIALDASNDIVLSQLVATNAVTVTAGNSILRNVDADTVVNITADGIQLDADAGVVGTLAEPIDIASPASNVLLYAGGEIGGVSANLTGTAAGNTILPLNPGTPSPGSIIFNGNVIGGTDDEAYAALAYSASETIFSQFGFTTVEELLMRVYSTDNPLQGLNLRYQPAITALWVLEDIEQE